jgi:HPt (histidine-containing phosphotransfer) domain-containing protein
MADDATDPLEVAMRPLRAEYLYEAPERIRDLSAALGRLRAGNAAALEDLERLFHRLAGSGGSYGFPAITEHSRAAEHAAIRLAGEARALQRNDFEVLEQHVLNVAEAFRVAQREFDAAAPPA